MSGSNSFANQAPISNPAHLVNMNSNTPTMNQAQVFNSGPFITKGSTPVSNQDPVFNYGHFIANVNAPFANQTQCSNPAPFFNTSGNVSVQQPTVGIPPHHQFTSDQHTFLDLLMTERRNAKKHGRPFIGLAEIADEFQKQYICQPPMVVIQAWCQEWENDMLFWMFLDSPGKIDQINPRERCMQN